MPFSPDHKFGCCFDQVLFPFVIYLQIGAFYMALITSLAVFHVIFCFCICCTCHSCWPWGRWVNHFKHKKFLIPRAESFLIPWLGYIIYALFKHGVRFGWGCLTYSVLDTLGTPVPFHWWIYFGILFNWPLCVFHNLWVHLIGVVHVVMEPINMVYGGVNASLVLQRGVYSNCCLSCGLFCPTRIHGRGTPVDILWLSRSGKWRLSLICPVRIIFGIMKLSSWGHEYH